MADSSSQNKKTLRLVIVASVVCILVLVLCIKFIDLKAMHEKVNGLNGWLIVALAFVLPLLGVPVSFLFVILGARFGHVWGLVLALVAVAFHLAASYCIGNGLLRKPLTWLFKKVNYPKPKIPEAETVPICALIALVPGIPYAIKNYMMVLADVKFWPFFWACLPTHFFSVTPGVLFGDFTGSMSKPKIIFLIVYFLVLIGMTRYVVFRLRKRQKVDVLAQKSAPDAA